MTPERLEEIKAANKARTPGKWYWFGYVQNKDLAIETFAPGTGGVREVMSFRRWGMQRAQPVFWDPKERLLVEAKEKLIITDQDSCHPKMRGVDVPDAKFMVDAPQYVTELLELVEQQKARIDELEKSALADMANMAQLLGVYDDYEGSEAI